MESCADDSGSPHLPFKGCGGGREKTLWELRRAAAAFPLDYSRTFFRNSAVQRRLSGNHNPARTT
jgi:hypothetical protein